MEEDKEEDGDECREEEVREAVEDIGRKDHYKACKNVVAEEEDQSIV